jgi:hypothetical protein
VVEQGGARGTRLAQASGPQAGQGTRFSICARGDHIGALKRQPFMSPADLIIAGELVYGSQWRKPLAKAIGYSRRMIWYYESGERQIPENVAISVRRLADLGPVGSLVRSSVKKAVPDLPPVWVHRIAVQILADLTGSGLVR